MSLIKDKIRVERFRKVVCNPNKLYSGYDLWPNKVVKGYNFHGFGDMTEEELVKQYYNSALINYCKNYLIFKENTTSDTVTKSSANVILTTLLNDIKYDTNQSNPLEHYELQLYRVWLIVSLVVFIEYINESKKLTILDLKDKTIDELEEIRDESTLVEIDKIKNNKWWKLWS